MTQGPPPRPSGSSNPVGPMPLPRVRPHAWPCAWSPQIPTYSPQCWHCSSSRHCQPLGRAGTKRAHRHRELSKHGQSANVAALEIGSRRHALAMLSTTLSGPILLLRFCAMPRSSMSLIHSSRSSVHSLARSVQPRNARQGQQNTQTMNDGTPKSCDKWIQCHGNHPK